MGSSLSRNINSEKLANEIKSIVTDLSYNRYTWWSEKKNCMKLELFYKEKLMSFEKHSLVGAISSIGIPVDFDYDKQQLCDELVNHYKRRLFLMNKIFDAVNKTQLMIKRLNTGDICVSVDKFVDNWNYCGQINGGWISQEDFKVILKKIKKNDKYKLYYSNVKDFELEYYKFLRILREYVYIIKEDIDNKMPDEEFDIIEKKILGIIDTTVSKCESFYIIGASLLDLT